MLSNKKNISVDAKKTPNSNSIFGVGIFLFSVILAYFSQSNCFFFDNTSQISIPANWFYLHGFSTLFLPDSIATGHPTIMGIYVSLAWKTFGYSLQTAHWAMLPFIFGFFWQSYLFAKKIFATNSLIALNMLVVMADACILSQSTLITFEIPHIFLFMLALNAILSRKNSTLVLSSIFLCLISLRGTISCAGLLVFDIAYSEFILKKISLKRVFLYTPGFLLIFMYLFVHYLSRGWAIHNTVSNAWEVSAKYASLPEMVRNIVLIGVRLFEYGRVILIVVFFFMFFNFKKIKTDQTLKMIMLCAITQAMFIFPTVIIYQNPFSTRYFLPFILLMLFAALYYIYAYYRKHIYILSLLLLFQIGGGFIVYPQKIAMPWDSTPAHWPFYSLREEMMQYIDTEKIGIENVSGGFNIFGDQKNIDLKRVITIIQEPTKKYYIHSNISNSADELIIDLENNKKWILIKRFSKRGVFIELYKQTNN